MAIWTTCLLVLALSLPARPLMSSAVDQRSSSRSSASATKSRLSTPSCDPTLEGDKPPQTIDGWLQVFYRCEIDGALNGTPITITGFVTHGTDDNLPDQFYYVSRFFMSCCTVDTKPISLPVVTAGMPRPAADTWITVSGKLRMEKINGINAYVIVNAATEEIPQPDNPYEYLGQDY